MVLLVKKTHSLSNQLSILSNQLAIISNKAHLLSNALGILSYEPIIAILHTALRL